jgi:GntR family transcriptional regulator
MSDAKRPKFAMVPWSVVVDTQLGHAPLRTYMVLAAHADKQGRCWPSHNTIGRIMGISRQAVIKNIHKLEAAGLVVKAHRERGNGSKTSNIYHMKGWSPEVTTAVTPEVTTPVTSGGYIHNKPINKPINKEAAVAENDDVDFAVDKWNELAEEAGLQKCMKITKQRRENITARLDDAGGTDGWIAALDKVRRSTVVREKMYQPRGITIDDLAKENLFTRLMEGQYDLEFERPNQPVDLMKVMKAAIGERGDEEDREPAESMFDRVYEAAMARKAERGEVEEPDPPTKTRVIRDRSWRSG